MNRFHTRNSPADEDDVFNTKTLLNRVGYYDEPDYGITPYPDGWLFQSIARFQKDHELTPDGWMKPGGETERAMRFVARRGRPGLIDDDFGFPSAGDFDLAGEIGKGHASLGNDVMMAKRASRRRVLRDARKGCGESPQKGPLCGLLR